MDLEIAGRKALVCASTRGLGRACALALAAEGVKVVINGRDETRCKTAAEEIRKETGGDVDYVAADITTEAGRAALVQKCPDADILITNNEGPPPGNFLDYAAADWLDALNMHMIAPLQIIKAVLPGMQQRKFGRIINITSAMVTRPNTGMELSTGPRTGLTAVVKAVSLGVAKDNVTINNMLPERIDTDRQIQMAHRIAKRENVSFEEARVKQANMLATKRLGRPSEFGATCAFLCSAHAGFISGQNIRLDGGSYPGLV